MPADLHERYMRLRDVPAFLAQRGITDSKGGPVRVQTVYKWIAAGYLEAYTVGAVRHTTAEALARMLERHTAGEVGRAEVRPRRRRTADDRRAAEECETGGW